MTERWIVKEVEYAPDKLEPGILYHGKELGFIQHLCACGCRIMVHVPTKGPGDTWKLLECDSGPTVEGSFSHRFYCRSHYSIVHGKTHWHLKRGPA